MRRLLAVAAALGLACPARAGLSCDPQDVRASLSAALEQYRSSDACGQEAALAWLNKLFPKGLPKARAEQVRFNGDADPQPYRPTPEQRKAAAARDATTPITPELLDLAVSHLQARLASGRIAAACTRDDVSGYWSADAYDCDGSLCGKLELGQRWVAKVSGSGFRTEMELRDADQLANAATHELSHMLVSYFRRVYGAADVDALDSGLQDRFQYLTFFNGCTLFQVNGAGREHAPIEYVAPNDMYDPARTGNEQAARMIAHAMQRCFTGKPNPFYARILGDPRGVDTCSR